MIQIIVNSDHNLEIGESEIAEIESTVQGRLNRFESRLTRVVVHLRDENAKRPGLRDVRCMVEARPAGMDSVNASDHASNAQAAVASTTHKLERQLEDIFGKLGRSNE